MFAAAPARCLIPYEADATVSDPASEMVLQASAVAFDGRALLITGPPGSGKSSLTLALLERGAGFIGDDGVTLTRKEDTIIAHPPPNIAGLLDVRGVGLAHIDLTDPGPVALVLELGTKPTERLPESLARRELLGCPIPVLAFDPGTIAPAQRALWALRIHGLRIDKQARAAKDRP